MSDSSDDWLEFHRRVLQTPSGGSGLDEAEASAASTLIHEVLVSHAVHIDALDVDGIVSHYAPDAKVLTALGTAEGLDAIRAYYSVYPTMFRRTMRYIGNVSVRLTSPTTAIAAAYNFTMATKNDGQSYSYGGLYEDDFVKVDGRWLIGVHRVVDGVAYDLEPVSLAAKRAME